MENNTKIVAYYILQNEYLKRNGINDKLDLDDYTKIEFLFPEFWFTSYQIDEKIEILTYAIKNNVSALEARISIKNQKSVK